MESLEDAYDITRQYTSQLQKHASAHTQALRETLRHLEDLDNRGRRNNIRVRGLPEAEGQEDLQLILEAIFNRLLGEPVSHKIKLDRAHRALRLKTASAQSRDAVCTIT